VLPLGQGPMQWVAVSQELQELNKRFYQIGEGR